MDLFPKIPPNQAETVNDEPGLVKDTGEDDFSPITATFLLGAFIDLLLLPGRHIINQIHK